MSDTIEIPKSLFVRMSNVLFGMEKFLQEREDAKSDWVSKEEAMKLLGCKKSKLFELKDEGRIKYKAVGKEHQYSRKSIEKYNSLISS